MTLVYILSDYEEYGAEDIHATLDPARLPGMLDAMGYDRGEPREGLAEFMAGAMPVGRHDLVHGWGGPVIDVVELE